MPTKEATSGLDLKLIRTAMRVRQREIARCMNVSASRVRAIEWSTRPTERSVRAYLAALAESRR